MTELLRDVVTWLVLCYGVACGVAGWIGGYWARPRLMRRGRHHQRR